MAEIDPVEFGAMQADVRQLKSDVAEMRGEVKELLALANRGKGMVWAARAAAGVFGGSLVVLAQKLLK